ncbi:MAG: hypothetical protein KAH86_02045 [Methanosarcinales archaeon]|nr:hypothetical protein [Methanosarcinales archaeon]
MSILHIIRNRNDSIALDTIRLQSESGEGDGNGDVGVLLIHDAVLDIADGVASVFPAGAKLHALSSDCDARAISQVDEACACDCVDYDAMLQLIFEYDKVITW